MIRCPHCYKRDPELTVAETKLVAQWLSEVRDNTKNGPETRKSADSLLKELHKEGQSS